MLRVPTPLSSHMHHFRMPVQNNDMSASLAHNSPPTKLHLRISMLARFESKLGRIELLELLRRRARCSLGSVGCKPENLANTLRTSVSEITPFNLPEMRVPAIADAGTAAVGP